MYRFLEFEKEHTLPSACEVYDKAISLFGMSKTFSMPGIRIGWIITQNKELYQRLFNLRHYTTICSSAPSEILALIALRSKDKIINNNMKVINKNLPFVENFFARNNDLFSYVKPQAGVLCFPKIKFEADIYELAEKIVQETGVMILPSTVYDYNNKHFRLGFGRKNFPEALSIFEKYMRA